MAILKEYGEHSQKLQWHFTIYEGEKEAMTALKGAIDK